MQRVSAAKSQNERAAHMRSAAGIANMSVARRELRATRPSPLEVWRSVSHDDDKQSGEDDDEAHLVGLGKATSKTTSAGQALCRSIDK